LHRNQGTESLEEPLRKYIKNTNVLIARLLRINELYMTDPINAEIQLTRVIVGWKHLMMNVKPSVIQRYHDGAYMYLFCSKYIGDEMIESRENLLHRHILYDLLEIHGELSPTYVKHLWTTIETCVEDVPSTSQRDFEPHLPFEVIQHIRRAKNPPTTMSHIFNNNNLPTITLHGPRNSNISDEASIPFFTKKTNVRSTSKITPNYSSKSSSDSDDDQDTNDSSDQYDSNGQCHGTPTYDTSFYGDRKRRHH
jgi:hypothetical protein